LGDTPWQEHQDNSWNSLVLNTGEVLLIKKSRKVPPTFWVLDLMPSYTSLKIFFL
jgi:hypothetical protein